MGVFLLGTVMVGPPFAPGIGILAEGGAGDGSQRSADQVLRCGVQGIVVKQIEELGNGGETLLASEHARTSEISSGAFADALRGIVGQNGKKRVNRFTGAEHGQPLNGPKARLLIGITRVAEKSGEDGRRLDAAIAESAESPEREIAPGGIAVNLIEKSCEALR